MNKHCIKINPLSDEDGLEYLPNPEYVGLNYLDNFIKPTKSDVRNYNLYKTIADVYNHYQFNTPPAHGDPKYSRLCGILYGLCLAYELDIDEFNPSNEVRVTTRSGRCIMIVKKPKLPDAYKEAVESNKLVYEQVYGRMPLQLMFG